MLLRLFQAIHERGRREESHPLAQSAGGKPQGDSQMRFSSSGTTEQAAVLTLIDPAAAGQLQNLWLREAGRRAKVECIEVLLNGKAGLLDPSLQGVGAACGQLQLRQS